MVKTPIKSRLLGIEAARGIAATMVVIYHAARHLYKNHGEYPEFFGIARFGHAGVDFFFVLSGFIIFFIHQQDIGNPNALLHYVRQRSTRIYPIYVFTLCVVIALEIFSHRPAPNTIDILINLTLLPTAYEPIVGVSWTLQHEVIFYAFFAVWIANRSAGELLFIVWLFAIAGEFFGLYRQEALGALARATAVCNIQFFFGMCAAYLLQWFRIPAPMWMLTLGISSFAALGYVEVLGLLDGYGVWGSVFFGLAAMLMILGLVEGERQELYTVYRPFQILGSASYSIYLVHLLAIGVAYKIMALVALPTILPIWTSHLILVATAITGGIVVSRFIEYPLMRAARRMSRRS